MFGFSTPDTQSLQARISELEISNDEAQARIQELEEEVKSYRQTIEKFHLSTSKYDKQLAESNKLHEKEVETLKAKLVETEGSVNKRLNQTLQTIGVSTFCLESTILIPKGSSSPQEAYNTFVAMPEGEAKKTFYKNNEALIKKAIGC